MKIRVLSIFSLLLIYISCVSAQVPESVSKAWQENKLAMKINFRMPINDKGEVDEDELNYAKFNADSIVSLAIKSGMQTIIAPAKAGDIYLFNISNDTKNGNRDFIKELSDACHDKKISFGIYFPYMEYKHDYEEYPASDGLSKDIKNQITRLLTGYGEISEIDFGPEPKTLEQSRELYELVHRLQPDCLVGNNAGNGQYDYCNIPVFRFQKEFLECNWRYEYFIIPRLFPMHNIHDDDSRPKAISIIRKIADAVSCGGGFMVNVFLERDGGIDFYDESIMKNIGLWLEENGEAIYDTERTPFLEHFDWGTVTKKDNTLYLILSGKYPKDGKIKLYMPEYELKSADGRMATCIQKNGMIDIAVPASTYRRKITPYYLGFTVDVLTLKFKQIIENKQPEPIRTITLKQSNSTPLHSFYGFDYNSKFKSNIKYSWSFEQLMLKQLELLYTGQEKDKKLEIELDGKTYFVTLNEGKASTLSIASGTVFGKQYICGPENMGFHASRTIETDMENPIVKKSGWKETTEGKQSFAVKAYDTYYVMQNIESLKEQNIIMDAGGGNGIEIYLNGTSVMKYLNPYGEKFRTRKVLIPLQKGNNQIVMRVYNGFKKDMSYILHLSKDQTIYKQELTLPEISTKKFHELKVRQSELPSAHSDTELSNLRIRLRRIAL